MKKNIIKQSIILILFIIYACQNGTTENDDHRDNL